MESGYASCLGHTGSRMVEQYPRRRRRCTDSRSALSWTRRWQWSSSGGMLWAILRASRPHTIISIPAAASVRAGFRRSIWISWLAEYRNSLASDSYVVQLSQSSSCVFSGRSAMSKFSQCVGSRVRRAQGFVGQIVGGCRWRCGVGVNFYATERGGD